MRIGTGGRTLSRDVAPLFPGEGMHLARPARALRCAATNSSFHLELRAAAGEAPRDA